MLSASLAFAQLQVPAGKPSVLELLVKWTPLLAKGFASTITPYGSDNPKTTLNGQSVTPVGGSQPHTNFQPYLCVNFIISLFGIFPSPT